MFICFIYENLIRNDFTSSSKASNAFSHSRTSTCPKDCLLSSLDDDSTLIPVYLWNFLFRARTLWALCCFQLVYSFEPVTGSARWCALKFIPEWLPASHFSVFHDVGAANVCSQFPVEARLSRSFSTLIWSLRIFSRTASVAVFICLLNLTPQRTLHNLWATGLVHMFVIANLFVHRCALFRRLHWI